MPVEGENRPLADGKEVAPDKSSPSAEHVPELKAGLGGRLVGYSKAFGRLLSERVGGGGVPYVFVCGVSSPDISAIEVGSFPGLLSCHSVEDAQHRYRVCSYWTGYEIFDAHRETFMHMLPGAAEIASGRLSQINVRSKALAERFPIWTIIITISGLIGAAAAIWEYLGRLVETPDITIAFKRDNRHDFENSEPPIVSFGVTNQCRFAPASVRIVSSLTLVGQPAGRMMEVGRLSRIEPGKASDFDIEGSVLAPTPNPGGAEEFELRIVVTAKAGLWRGEKQFPFTSPTFRQWQPVGWTGPKKFRVNADTCYLRGILYSGRAQKVTASITVGMRAGVDSVVTSLLDQDYTSSVPSDTGQVRMQVFTTGDIPRFGAYPYTIRVNSRAMSDEACDDLAHTLVEHNNVIFQ